MKASAFFALHSIFFLWGLPTVLGATGQSRLKGFSASNRKLSGNRRLQDPKEPKLGPTHRECKYSQKSDAGKSQEVKVSCKSRSADELLIHSEEDAVQSRGMSLYPDESIRDKIQYKVKTENTGISVKVEYNQDYSEAEGFFYEGVEETKTQFEVVFDSIIEYSKGDGKNEQIRTDEEQAYDWNSDSILQTIYLTDWESMTTVQDDEDGMVSYWSVRSLDGIVWFNFTISRADVGEKVTANSMKIDVLISNFPWMRKDTNLALMSSVTSKLKVKMGYNEAATVMQDRSEETVAGVPLPPDHAKHTRDVVVSFEDAAEAIGIIPFGAYSWESLAEVSTNNVILTTDANEEAFINVTNLVDMQVEKDTIQVVGTSPTTLGNETSQLIAYSFVGSAAHNASEIYWDPEAGIGYSSAMRSAFSRVLSGLGSAMVISGALLLAF